MDNHLFKNFSRSAKSVPSKTAITYLENNIYKQLTYNDLYKKIVCFGQFLKKYNLKNGDKIALILGNQPEYPIAFFGIMYAQTVAVPIDIQFSPEHIKNIFIHSEAKVLITTQKISDQLSNHLPKENILVIDSPKNQKNIYETSVKNQFKEPVDYLDSELAVLFYTSGTTAVPKAVMLSHKNLLSNIKSIQQLKIVQKDDIVVSLLPLHHAYSFTVTLLAPFSVGASIVYPPGLTSIELLSCLEKTKPTIFVGVPQIFTLMSKSIHEKFKKLSTPKKLMTTSLKNIFHVTQKISTINLNKYLFSKIHKRFGGRLRFMISGGARLNPETAKAFTQWGFSILEGYGLTETSPVSAFNLFKKSKINSVGTPVSDVKIKIISPNKKGVGEVAIQGANVMLGYYKSPKETAEVIKDNWFYSGDLGYLDRDGYLFLTGRKKEIIVLNSGKNINPEDVETYYSQCPYIKEIGILMHQVTNHLVAIIIPNENYFKQHPVMSIYEKLKWELENISIKLPTYKRIQGFVISNEDLPRTRLGKLIRYKFTSLYDNLIKTNELTTPQQSDVLSPSNHSILIKSSLEFIEQSLNQKIKIKDHLELDLGLDSLEKIELLMGIQDHLKLDISEESMMDFFMSNTINDLIEHLKKNTSSENILSKPEPQDFMWSKIMEEQPNKETLDKISLTLNGFQIIINIFLISLFKIFFKIFFLLKVEGREHFKKNTSYIICPNHTSYLDGLLILSALPFHASLQTYFLGESRFFEHFLLKPFIHIARLIPIQTSFNFIEAIKACLFVLKNKKNICYFPEGQRSIDGEIKEFKKGIGILMQEGRVPVIPVYIEGAFKAWSRAQRFPKCASIKIKFGKPIFLSKNLKLSTDKEYQSIAQNLQKEVSSLIR